MLVTQSFHASGGGEELTESVRFKPSISTVQCEAINVIVQPTTNDMTTINIHELCAFYEISGRVESL
jgi:hypothetical protein